MDQNLYPVHALYLSMCSVFSNAQSSICPVFLTHDPVSALSFLKHCILCKKLNPVFALSFLKHIMRSTYPVLPKARCIAQNLNPSIEYCVVSCPTQIPTRSRSHSSTEYWPTNRDQRFVTNALSGEYNCTLPMFYSPQDKNVLSRCLIQYYLFTLAIGQKDAHVWELPTALFRSFEG